MSPADLKLIVLAVAAIGVLVLLVTWLKLNAFVSLVLASLVVGAGAVLMGQTIDVAGGKVPYSMLGVARSIQDGIGGTLGGIAAVLGLGTMLGKLLAESGGAEVLAKRFAAFFGARRIQWCIIALALAVGLTTWFAVGLILLLPILLTLTRETKQPFLLLVLPLLSCLSVMHGLMPPHPGPVVAVEMLKANMGLVLFWGFVVGIPTAMVAGPLYARWAVKRVEAHPVAPAAPDVTDPDAAPPGASGSRFFFHPAPGDVDATRDRGRAGPCSRDIHCARRQRSSAIRRWQLLISVMFSLWSLGTALRLSQGPALEVYRGQRRVRGHDDPDCRWRRWLCPRAARQRCGGCDRTLRRTPQPFADALWLVDLGLHPRGHGLGHGGDHHGVRAAGAGPGFASRAHALARRPHHRGDRLRLALPVAPQRRRLLDRQRVSRADRGAGRSRRGRFARRSSASSACSSPWFVTS